MKRRGEVEEGGRGEGWAGEGQRRKINKNEVQATASASYCRLLQMQGERTTHAMHSGKQDLTP